MHSGTCGFPSHELYDKTLYVCVYIYIYICICVYIYNICIYVYAYICLFIYLFVYIPIRMNTRVVAFTTALIPDSEFGELELGRGG